MNMRKISLFVPGRLCIIGEHSDWAGMYRTVNAKLMPGAAIVTGTEQGIYGDAEKSEKFEITSDLPLYHSESFSCPMDNRDLLKVAQDGGFFSYVAGVASYINENYNVGGVKITITKMDLPVKSGLSSSAAICVLVARAFNRLYKLHMNIKGEMQAAFRGEQRTPSRCGRLDQACAYGIKPVLMTFDGVEIDSRELRVGATMHWVVANLNASKDTIKILADLNSCYPFSQNITSEKVQEALGRDNIKFIEQAQKALEEGSAERLGQIMNSFQENFDRKVMPACSELKAPVLHSLLKDERIIELTYGRKGVGSQGDGSVQFLAKDKQCADKLIAYLTEEKGLQAFSLSLHPGQTVRKAVIPLAGFGTRLFPATKCIKKCFLPVLDHGTLKPGLLVMLEELIMAGIEEVCLIIGEDDQQEFESFFAALPDEVVAKLAPDKKEIYEEIMHLRERITYVIQKERLGLGHAVWLSKSFANGEPIVLMLGDFIYKSNQISNCCKQLLDAFLERGLTTVSIQQVSLNEVINYGILAGKWICPNNRIMAVNEMAEKPTVEYANMHLGVLNNNQQKSYYATFGQYILTADVYGALENLIKSGKKSGEEFQLTDALEEVRREVGLDAFFPDGECFDLGLPNTYYESLIKFAE